MTRVLSKLLGASEPRFSITIQKMERAAGNPSNDVRLTAELIQRSREKVRQLGLDPHDTTTRELYRVIEERIGNDDLLVRRALSIADDASAAEITQAVVQYIQHQSTVSYTSFALKPSVTKRLLKKQPPKKAMKQLNYRSVDSLLKHESAQHVYVAAFLCESLAWRKKLMEQYSKLRPSDFETRQIDISTPQTARWVSLATQATNSQRHNVFVAKELGSITVLPVDSAMPGLAITTLVLILNAMNDVMSAGSFLKLQQVKQDFGAVVRVVATGETITAAQLEGQPVPWRVVHQYYARHSHSHSPTAFEPHITASDLNWHHPEAVLASLHPDLAFWLDTRYTGFSHEASSVSLNILDVAINYYNHLPYADRVSDFLRQHLWQEFMLRYLNFENVEHAIAGELAPQLAYAKVPSEDEFDA